MRIQPEHINKEVLIKLKAGDMHAFKNVFVAYGDNLYNFAMSYLKDEFEAEEIVQDVFLRIWEMRNDIDVDKSFKSFLYKMTVNKVFNHLKHQVVRKKYENYLFNFDDSFHESPETSLHYKELNKKLQTLIQKLPEQQRNIFQLSRSEGLSNSEISGQLGLSIRTVENQIYRASKFLKEHLKEEYLFFIFCLFFLF